MSQDRPNNDPLMDLMNTYRQCLDLGQNYLDHALISHQYRKDEMDVDCLDQFLAARSDLISSAASSLECLASYPIAPEDQARQELKGKVVAIMEEVGRMEQELTTFIDDRIHQLGETIKQMKKSQPVFKRYGNLGNPNIPSRITRHE